MYCTIYIMANFVFFFGDWDFHLAGKAHIINDGINESPETVFVQFSFNIMQKLARKFSTLFSRGRMAEWNVVVILKERNLSFKNPCASSGTLYFLLYFVSQVILSQNVLPDSIASLIQKQWTLSKKIPYQYNEMHIWRNFIHNLIHLRVQNQTVLNETQWLALTNLPANTVLRRLLIQLEIFF